MTFTKEFPNSYLKIWHDYEFARSKYNWFEFTFIQLRLEFNYATKNNEIHIALLGLHFFYNWAVK